MSLPLVVDTNVPLVAKGLSNFSDDCVERCVDELTRFLDGQHCLVLDDGDRILDEYMSQLCLSGQPTVGDAFLKWVFSNQAVEGSCEKVQITAISEEEQIFQEFPTDPALAAFDRSDRKFVAVACAHPARPAILEATDTKWVDWSVPLSRAGVDVRFVCYHEICARHEKKFGPTKGEKSTPKERSSPKPRGRRRRG
ncbi:MAG: hypothetical protein IT372_01870 [Polyangiaceae bacterium]|nr:hypothetical protein [Polyangiaceae bacterium]